MNIQTSVFYVGGSKGGVGKSLFSFALVDYLLDRNANILLVDTDTDNPDVFKAHKELALPNLLCRLNSLDDADGWADLLDTVQNYPEHAVVINAAAQAKLTKSVVKEAEYLASKIQYGKLVPLWLLALICLLAYGSLMLWAGFRIDTGRDIPLAEVLHMPSGWLISGLCLITGGFFFVLSGKIFLADGGGWWKTGVLAMGLIMAGAAIFVLSL